MANLAETLLAKVFLGEGAHGQEHAEMTLNLCNQIWQEPEYRGIVTEEDLMIVTAAAIFHDVGYSQRRIYWSGIQEEHSYESAIIAHESLPSIPWFAEDSRRTLTAALLIANHDNTNYLFPAYEIFEAARKNQYIEPVGRPSLWPETIINFRWIDGQGKEQIVKANDVLPREKFIPLLHILQEADSRQADIVQRTMNFSISRKIPITSNDGGIPGIGMPMWQFSGLANVLLALYRGLIDAYSKTGQEAAWRNFEEGRDFIKKILEEDRETQLARLTPDGQEYYLGSFPPDFDNVGEILRFSDAFLIWDRGSDFSKYGLYDKVYIESAAVLAGTQPLLKERLGKKVASIASRLVKVADIDCQDYQVRDKSGIDIETLDELRKVLIARYAWDIFTITSGILTVKTFEPDPELGDRTNSYTLVPPVLHAREGILQGIRHPPYQLLDGLEWVNCARILGLEEMRVLFVD